MSTDLQNPPQRGAATPEAGTPTGEQNMTALVTGILNDAQELFRQQVHLVRHEVQEDFRKTKQAAVPLAIGLWFVALGSILLSVTLALLLAETGLYPWACFAIVGVAVSAVGGGLFYVGKKKFASFNPLPDESAEALKENLEWIAKPK